MTVYVSFVHHKKSVSKREVCIIFIKNKKFKKTRKKQKKNILVVFYVVFFKFFGWAFLSGFFIGNPALPQMLHRWVRCSSPSCTILMCAPMEDFFIHLAHR
jgi:hypothetical protein